MSSGMPLVRRGACAPNPSYLVELFSLECSWLLYCVPLLAHLPGGSMEWWRDGVLRISSIIPKNVEVWAFVADDGHQTTVSGKDASHDKSEYLSMIVCPSGDCFDPLGHIIHYYQNILFPAWRWERSHEVYPPKIKNLHFKDRPHRHFISLGDIQCRLTL